MFGGGRTGCMGAVHDGCHSKGGRSIGVIHETFLPTGALATDSNGYTGWTTD